MVTRIKDPQDRDDEPLALDESSWLQNKVLEHFQDARPTENEHDCVLTIIRILNSFLKERAKVRFLNETRLLRVYGSFKTGNIAVHR